MRQDFAHSLHLLHDVCTKKNIRTIIAVDYVRIDVPTCPPHAAVEKNISTCFLPPASHLSWVATNSIYLQHCLISFSLWDYIYCSASIFFFAVVGVSILKTTAIFHVSIFLNTN